MNRAKLLTIFASEMKEINNIDQPDQLAWRQTRNSLGIIATELPPQHLPRSLLLEGNRESVLEEVMCAALLSRFAVAVMLRCSTTGTDAGPNGLPTPLRILQAGW